jgi:hypothetical protein
MLSKHLVEPVAPPSQRRPDLGIPAAVDAVILGAMAKDPRARPPTMEAFGEQIAALRQRLAAEPGPPRAPAIAGPEPAHPDAPYPGAGSAPVAHAPPAMPGAPLPGAPPPAHALWSLAPAPTPAGPARSPVAMPVAARRKVAIIAIAGVLTTGAGIGALVLANHGHPVVAPTPPAPAPAPVAADAPAAPPADAPEQAAVEVPAPPVPEPVPSTPPAPGPRRPTPAPRPSRPAPVAPAAPASSQRMSIGQGVQLVIPAGFQISARNNVVVAINPRGVLIAGGPIAIASNDPKQLAQYHARVNHLVLDKLDTMLVGGAQRPAALFHGMVGKVAIGQIVVALIGPKYRVAVALQIPAALANDPATTHLALDVFMRGIIFP